MTYAEKLKDPRWQKLRLEVLNRDNFSCKLCFDTSTELHIHHFEYAKSGNPWDSSIDNLVTYCKHCHSIISYIKETGMAPYIYLIHKFGLPNNTGVLAMVFNGLKNDIDFFLYNNEKSAYAFTLSEDVIHSISKSLLDIQIFKNEQEK